MVRTDNDRGSDGGSGKPISWSGHIYVASASNDELMATTAIETETQSTR